VNASKLRGIGHTINQPIKKKDITPSFSSLKCGCRRLFFRAKSSWRWGRWSWRRSGGRRLMDKCIVALCFKLGG